MSEPLIVKIPHKLGKEEALRRIKPALGKASSAHLLSTSAKTKDGFEVARRASQADAAR
jgi:hypothetical protein